MKKFDQLNQQEAKIKKKKIAGEKNNIQISPKIIVFILLFLAILVVGVHFLFRDTSDLKPTLTDIQAANAFVKDKSDSYVTSKPTIEPEYDNAVNSAKSFLKDNPYSYRNMVKELTEDGYPEEVAKYGAANCGADWNEQAVRRARLLVTENHYSHEQLAEVLMSDDGFTRAQAEYGASAVEESLTTNTPIPTDIPPEYNNAINSAQRILKSHSLSRDSLISTLEERGYTNTVAAYGADNCGADWNELAVRKARQYLDKSDYSKEELIILLEDDGFTKEQAEYGASGV